MKRDDREPSEERPLLREILSRGGAEELPALKERLSTLAGVTEGRGTTLSADRETGSRSSARETLAEPRVFTTLSGRSTQPEVEVTVASAVLGEDERLDDLPVPARKELVSSSPVVPHLDEIRNILPALEEQVRADPERVEAWVGLGEGQLAVGRMEDAAKSFETAHALLPDEPRHLLLLARARFGSGDYSRTVEPLREALQLNPPERDPYLLLLADAYQKQGLYDDETDTCVELLSTKPRDPVLLFRLGMAYTHLGLQEMAFKAFILAIRANPEFLEAHLNLGALLRSRGATADAIRTFRNVLERKPDCWEAYYNLGFLYSKERIYPRAVWAYERAFRSCPHPEALGAISYNLGIVCVQMGLWREAAEAFKVATDTRPENPHYWFNRAVCLGMLPDLAPTASDGAISAADAYRKAIELDPFYVKAYMGLVEWLYRSGDPHGAEAVKKMATSVLPEASPLFDTLVPPSPSEADASDLGVDANRSTIVTLMNPQLKEACYSTRALGADGLASLTLVGKETTVPGMDPLSFTAEAELEPESADVSFYLGLSLANKKEYTRALDSIEQGIAFDPNFAKAHLVAARICLKLGNREKAFFHARKGATLDPDDAESELLLAELYFDRGEYRYAFDSSREALADDPRLTRALLVAALSMERQGRRDDAISFLRRYVDENPADPVGYRELARVYDDQGDYEQGLETCQQAFWAGVHDPGIWVNLGVLLLHRDETELARVALQQAVDLAPHDALALGALAVALDRTGEEVNAIGAFTEALTQTPNDPDLHHNLGLLHYRAGRLEQAEELFRRALTLDPLRADVMNDLALVVMRRGNPSEGVGLITSARELEPDQALWMFNLAFARMEAGQFRDAIEAARGLVRKHPAFHNAKELLWNLAQAHSSLGEHAQALTRLKGVLLVDPDDLDALLNVSGVALELNDLATSRQAIDRAALIDPDDPRVLVNRGVLLQESGASMTEVLSLYERAAQRSNEAIEGLFNLGVLAASENERARSIEYLKAAVAVRPDFYEATLALGLVAQLDRQTVLAEQSYRRALEIRGTSYMARVNLGVLLMDQGNLEEAKRFLVQASELDPEQALPHFNLGVLAETASDTDDAVKEYNLARQLDPSSPDPSLNLGAIRERAGLDEEALLEYTRALESDPSLDEGYMCLGRLLLRLGRAEEAESVYLSGLLIHPSNRRLKEEADRSRLLAGGVGTKSLVDQATENGSLASEEKAVADAASELSCEDEDVLQRPESPFAWGRRGLTKYRLGDFAGALEDLGKAAELNPESVEILTNLGAVFGAHGMLDEELSCYETALEKSPDFAPALVNSAWVFLDRGQLDFVLELLDPLLSGSSLSSPLYSSIGACLFRAGFPDRASHAYALAAVGTPDDPRIGFNLAVTWIRTGEVDRALSLLTMLSELPGAGARVHAALAHLCRERFDLAGEIDHWQRAVVAEPTYLPARTNLSAALLEARMPDAALSALDESPSPFEDCPAAQFNRALALEAVGRLAEARRAYGRAARLLPELHEIHLNLAFLYRAQGDHRREIRELKQALSSSRDCKVAGPLLALAHLLSGRPRRALPYLRELPKRYRALLAGAIHLLSGRLEKAEARYESSLAIHRSAEALYGLALVHLRNGKADEAEACLAGLLEKRRGGADVLIQMARAQELRKNHEGECDLLAEAQALYPDSPIVLAALADAVLARGRFEEADRLYLTCVDRLSAGPAGARSRVFSRLASMSYVSEKPFGDTLRDPPGYYISVGVGRNYYHCDGPDRRTGCTLANETDEPWIPWTELFDQVLGPDGMETWSQGESKWYSNAVDRRR